MKLYDNIKATPSLDTDVYETDTEGTDYVDTKGYGDGMLLVQTGDVTSTTGDSYTVTVYECDTTDGTYATTGISVTFSNGSEDDTVSVARIAGLNTNRKRYLRADLTASAETVSFEGGAVILMGEAASNPVN